MNIILKNKKKQSPCLNYTLEYPESVYIISFCDAGSGPNNDNPDEARLMSAYKKILYPLLFLGIIALTTGCVATGPTGKWQTNSTAQQAFETGQLLKNHTYYTTGSESIPDAVIAIDNAYTLKTKIWTRTDITQKKLDDWRFWFKTDTTWRCPYSGGYIITPDGETAGMWYSKRTMNTIKTPETGIIEVYIPFFMDRSCQREKIVDDR